MEITHIKTIKLTAEDIEKALKEKFGVPAATVEFRLTSDPQDDGPGFPRYILAGAVLTEDQLAMQYTGKR
jgi:hypothetical protein